MKRVVRVKLTPEGDARDALVEVLAVMNDAANAVSEAAWHSRSFKFFGLQKAHYHDIRELFSLGAQPALHVLRKVADSYKLDKNTKRQFRPGGAIAFDDRCLSWQVPELGNHGTVSIWTVRGRQKNVPFVGSVEQVALLRLYRQGESDLSFDGENFYLTATLDIPAPVVAMSLETTVDNWLGVDMGIVNIAVTSNGSTFSGKRLNHYRKRQVRLRAELQAKGTKAAKRRLKARRRKEARHASHVNHRIAKQIVAEAERTGKGIATEDLTGIRNRARLRKPQRTSLNSWAFHQLGQYLAYKAEAKGIAHVSVNPAYTSQECSVCGHIDKKNRPSQAVFCCRDCKTALPADHNAGRVIAKRAPSAWAEVNQPQPDTAKAA